MEEVFVLLKVEHNQSKCAVADSVLGRRFLLVATTWGLRLRDTAALAVLKAGIAQRQSVASVWRRMRVKVLLPAPTSSHL